MTRQGKEEFISRLPSPSLSPEAADTFSRLLGKCRQEASGGDDKEEVLHCLFSQRTFIKRLFCARTCSKWEWLSGG